MVTSFLHWSIAGLFIGTLFAGQPTSFNTKWIPAKPEMQTYKSTSKQGSGYYQVSISQSDSTISIYMNIITPGFTKTVSGTMRSDMKPIGSTSKIIVGNQIIMNTECSYERDILHIQTVMKPYNQIIKNDVAFSQPVFDFSQLPLVARTLPLKVGAKFEYQCLNPQNNTVIPFTMNVVSEETVSQVPCYKVESFDFEGESVFWIEKGERKRIIRIEQPATGRVTELI